MLQNTPNLYARHVQHTCQQRQLCRQQVRFPTSRAKVAVADAQTQQQTATVFGWGTSSVQGPRPTMEDELRLETDAKAGFTYAGDAGRINIGAALVALLSTTPHTFQVKHQTNLRWGSMS